MVILLHCRLVTTYNSESFCEVCSDRDRPQINEDRFSYVVGICCVSCITMYGECTVFLLLYMCWSAVSVT